MRTSLLTLSSLSTSALALEAFTPADSFNAMLKRGDALLKRQEGYYPDTTSCGRGDTCEEACGLNQLECPSESPFTLFCHSSVDGSACCPDASGYSCRAGYYCTSDGRGRTYCCPNGVDTPECARQYSLTVSLIRQSSTAVVPSVALSSGAQVVTPATGSSSVAAVATLSTGNSALATIPTVLTKSSAANSASTSAGSSGAAVESSTPAAVPNPSIATVSQAPLPTFTGGAVRNLGARIVAFFGAGIAFL